MTRAVRHRGPDGEGLLFATASNDRVYPTITDESPAGTLGTREPPGGCVLALGHRRLSILDLSCAGHQPMPDSSRECWITFNGEIYNYRELRSELVSYGHKFHTETDTEVILAAWRQWGEQCLPRFNGMFAFVVFDQRTRRLFAARDRFGIKPLYFWTTPQGGLAIASEIKQFVSHPGWIARVNGQRAYDFLNWGIIDHTAETLFSGVRQLRGGEFLTTPIGPSVTLAIRRWYELPQDRFDGDFTAASLRFRELLDDSVRLRLRADVPVGSCLSGGLDSSSIVCTVRRHLGARADALQKTFSAYSDVTRFDERKFIEAVAAATSAVSHHVVPEPATLFDELDQVAWHQDEPFGSTSVFAQWCVFRLSRAKGVTVMLDGQGADEALGGYHGYFGPRLAGLLRSGRWLTLWREAALIRSQHGQSVGLQARLLANELLDSRVADSLRRLTGRTVAAPNFLDLSKLGAAPRSPHQGSVDLSDPVRSLSRAQLTSLNLPMLLHWEDRDSMAHGIEARLPFLDYRLVEFCLSLPEPFKLAGATTKRVLREGMSDRLPELIRLRQDKLGFATAEEVWMRERAPASFLRLVEGAIEAAQGVLTPAALARARRIIAGQDPFNFVVWRMISYGRWLSRFGVSL